MTLYQSKLLLQGWGINTETECLPHIHEALSSVSNTTKENQKGAAHLNLINCDV
jgi:hypothetical protein